MTPSAAAAALIREVLAAKTGKTGGDASKKELVSGALLKAPRDAISAAASAAVLGDAEGGGSDCGGDTFAFLRRCLVACGMKAEPDRRARLASIRRTVISSALSLLMRDDFLPPSTVSAVTEILVEDLDDRDFDAVQLLRLFGQCRNEVRQNRASLNPRWFPVLRQIIVNLYCRDKLVFADGQDDASLDETAMDEDGSHAEMSGPVFRLKVLRDLCALDWRSRHSAAFCVLFRELDESAKLSAEESALLVERMSWALRRLPPQEVPPLAHQMLEFCRDPAASSVLLQELAEYFNSRMAKVKGGQLEEDLSQESADLISGNDSGECERTLLQAEATVMFHLAHAARIGHPIYKDVLRLLRQSSQSPEVVLGGQFQIFLVMSLSSLQSYRQTVVDGMKGLVSKCVALSLRRQRDGWFRGVTEKAGCWSGPGFDVSGSLCRIVEITNLYQGWDLIGAGIVDLFFAMLDAKPGLGKPDAKLKTMWSIGNNIALKTLKSCSSSIRTVLPLLTKRIKSSQGAPQYTECLRRVVKESLSLCMENAAMLGDLASRLHTLGLPGAKRTIVALLPLIRVNRSLRDATILTLNKALFDRSNLVKDIGMTGLLQLMKIFKVSSALPITQLSQSSGSLTQMSVGIHRGSSSGAGLSSINVTLCSEIVSAVRKGLSQTAHVRLTLYTGLYDVVARNPGLCSDILTVLYEHAVDMGWNSLRSMEDGGGLLDLDLVIDDGDNACVVKDPIGWFFNCVQQLTCKSEEIHGGDEDDDEPNEGDHRSREKLKELLDELAKRYSEADFLDMGFEKEAEYSRETPDGERNVAKAELAKNLLEALMDFTITHGADVNEPKARRLLGLFKRHEEVSSLLKGTNPLKRPGAPPGRGRKKKADVDDTVQQEKQKALGGGSKGGNVFSMPEYACTIRSVTVMLKALTASRDEGDQGGLSIIREECPEFALFLARVFHAKISQVDTALTESAGVDNLSYELWMKHAKAAAKLCLDIVCAEGWKDDLCQHRETVVAECVDSLQMIMGIVGAHFPDKLDGFMTKIVEDTSSNTSLTGLPQSLGRLAEIIIDQIATVQARSVDDGEGGGNKEAYKTVGTLIRILSFVTGKLDCSQAEDAVVMKKICDWCRDFEENSHVEILTPFAELFFSANRALKESSNVANEIAAQLRHKVGDIEARKVTRITTFSFVTAPTSETVLRALHSHMDSMMDSAETLIGWCKHRQAQYKKEDEADLRKLEFEASCLLGRAVHTDKELVKTNFRIECILDHVLPMLSRLYSTMALLARYFCARARHSRDCIVHAKFDALVNLVGKELSNAAYQLIGHVQKIQDEMTTASDRSTQGRKGKSSGAQIRSQVLKESKGIPNLIFRIEAFENEAIKLGAKCKVDLLGNTKLPKSRDFRFAKEALLQEADENEDPHGDESTKMDSDDGDGRADGQNNGLGLSQPSQAANTTMNSVLQSTQKSHAGSSIIDSPPSKKLKVKMGFNRSRK